MEDLLITRILDGKSRGSSRPVIAETTNGHYLIKLRGSAQGCGALVAEIIVAEIAKELGLNVLPLFFAQLNPNTPTDDKNDELADLLKASFGVNLAFPFLKNAREITASDCLAIAINEKAAILWLDKFVMNPDRHDTNTNLLLHEGKVFAIDHGASLRFQYDWHKVTEISVKEKCLEYKPHLFESLLFTKEWKYWDQLFSHCITREVLQRAVYKVPDTFIESLDPVKFGSSVSEENKVELMHRRREAYIAFLWKRLKAPRLFAHSEAA